MRHIVSVAFSKTVIAGTLQHVSFVADAMLGCLEAKAKHRLLFIGGKIKGDEDKELCFEEIATGNMKGHVFVSP